MLIRGTCHCGNIAFDLTWEPDPTEIPARACDCSFCTKHGGVWTSHPSATLAVSIERPERISAYVFGTRTAVFHTCSHCGVVPVATSRIDDHCYAIVNVNTFEAPARSLLRAQPVTFEGEIVDTRLARRARNWIGRVTGLA
jgi:hypothetical protein